ncbi:hypothetical protein GUJ93_ZPchr0006g44785 [Zizania palustris]|uniref:CRAL/TRIO N-terminal domain-containing protein n=1 Tax=Zizania palustris TaxID=103762 RepID=A0A8J5VV91_ZIZPA|nr:hypothetical protein GUJ93_ZPchr0006g44785 [Zizania palustris]
MSSASSLNKADGKEAALFEEQLRKIGAVRAALGQLSGKKALYCSDASIARYLIARNWDVKKATKMLKKTLEWRSEYKPDEIRWDEIADEAATGKIYRTDYVDKSGRSILIMRPACQMKEDESKMPLFWSPENSLLASEPYVMNKDMPQEGCSGLKTEETASENREEETESESENKEEAESESEREETEAVSGKREENQSESETRKEAEISPMAVESTSLPGEGITPAEKSGSCSLSDP